MLGRLNQDIVECTIAYISQAMATVLDVSPTNPAVYSDFAPDQPKPYAVVLDANEFYEFTSNDVEEEGPACSVVVTGVLHIVFVTEGVNGKVQARFLARQCARLCNDIVVTLEPEDAALLEFRPTGSQSIPVTDSGVAAPTVFKRVVSINYKQQYNQ